MKNQEVIDNFMKAIYGDYVELAKSSFNEIEALKTATEIITELREDKDRLNWLATHYEIEKAGTITINGHFQSAESFRDTIDQVMLPEQEKR